METVLLFVNEDPGLESRLQAALDLVRAFDGHLACLRCTPFDSFILGDPFGGVYALPVVVEEIQARDSAHRARLEERLGREGISWDWLSYEGPPAQTIIDRSRLADIVVLSLPPAADSRRTGGPLPLIGEVAVHARALVLGMPTPARSFNLMGAALVAWNGSMESAHALKLALPLLRKASAVHIVTVDDDGGTDFPSVEASEYLARHDVGSELHEWVRQERRIATAIIDAAGALDADYIVAGAYGHSRFREAILGGATQGLIEASPLPLVLAH